MEMNTSEDFFFGELLRQFRKRKRLNQKQLAERIEVSHEAVSLWERGEYKPEADRILYKIVDVLGLTTQEQQQLFGAYTVTALAVSFHNPPLVRNPYFTGRSPQLTHLHMLLMAGKQVALTQAISGLGGIGKTQLALEYAYRYQKSYHDIFWAFADTYESLMTSYVRLAAILHLPEYDEPDQSKVKVAVQRWLSKYKGWLLILDNIEDLNLVRQFVPVDRQGAVLLTTRQQVTEPVAQTLELGTLPENDGILFLLKRTKILTFDMSLEDASAHDIADARTITWALGNLPLALDQAGAYILETRCSFANYLDLFEKHQAELLRRRAGGKIPTDHPESVAATFTLNFQQVQQRSEVAVDLLRVCAFLAPDDIGEEIFVQGASELGPSLHRLGSDGLLLNQAIEVLRTFSLIQRDPEKKTLTIHRLVQAVLKDRMDGPTYWVWAKRTVQAVERALPELDHRTTSRYERCLPHARECALLIEQMHLTSSAATRLLHQTGLYLLEHARYTEAEAFFHHCLRIYKQVLGSEHPEVAYLLNNLALLYSGQGKYAEAEPLYQKALRIGEQALGPEHPQVANMLTGLANLYNGQGKYAEAELLYQRALHIREQALGPEHPDVASLLTGLALLYDDQGKYAEAELLYRRALHIREHSLGSQHPETAEVLYDFAGFHRAQGNRGEAELLYQRTLAIRERVLGPQHPKTVATRTHYTALLRETGWRDNAARLEASVSDQASTEEK